MADVAGFHHLWHQYYPGLPPLAYVLHEKLPNLWWRFHSLPESKQYPDSLEERTILLHRHNTLATEVLGQGQECWLVQSLYTEEHFPPPDPLQKIIDSDGAEWSPVLTDMLTRIDFASVGVDPDLPLSCAAFPTRWEPGKFDDFLCYVAINYGRFLFIETKHGQVYAPYNGGADLIVDTTQKRDEMKAAYSDWLSTHPSGL